MCIQKTKTGWKVEIRTQCKICGGPLPSNRHRTYCSKKCSQKEYTQRYKEKRTNWQRKKRDREAAKFSPLKVQCLVCGKYYVQVCTHVLQVHKITARRYKQEFGLDVKKGRVPKWYRFKKGLQAIENETYLNLKSGEKYWFKKGDKEVGKYERSNETMERLKVLYKLTEAYAKRKVER